MEIDFLSDFSIERKIFDILNCLITIGINSAKLENLYGKLALVCWLTQQNSLWEAILTLITQYIHAE